MLTIEDFVSLVDIEFVSTAKKLPSLADFQFVSMCLHVYKQESFLIRLLFSFFPCDYMSTTIKLPSLSEFQFLSTCLL